MRHPSLYFGATFANTVTLNKSRLQGGNDGVVLSQKSRNRPDGALYVVGPLAHGLIVTAAVGGFAISYWT